LTARAGGDSIRAMGEVRVEVAVINPRTGMRSEGITALADTGATLTVVPGSLLERLEIDKTRTIVLVLADGRRVQRHVGDAAVAVDGDAAPCRVVFGEAGDATLLGLTVLEQLGLAVDPVQRLVPADFLLY
jgi:predicted aspartyl protease